MAHAPKADSARRVLLRFSHGPGMATPQPQHLNAMQLSKRQCWHRTKPLTARCWSQAAAVRAAAAARVRANPCQPEGRGALEGHAAQRQDARSQRRSASSSAPTPTIAPPPPHPPPPPVLHQQTCMHPRAFFCPSSALHFVPPWRLPAPRGDPTGLCRQLSGTGWASGHLRCLRRPLVRKTFQKSPHGDVFVPPS